MESLPDEVLLAISGHLSENCHLRQLSRVSPKLRHIAQEILVKHARIPRNGIGKLVKLLCRRPDLAMKVNSVDLGKYQDFISYHAGVVDPEEILSIEQPEFLGKCRTLVDIVLGEGHWARIIAASAHNDDFWNIENRLYLNILVSISPNLKKISLALPERFLPDSFDQAEPEYYRPFPPFAATVLQNTLKSLTIPYSLTWTPPNTYNLNFRGLSQLVRLSVPMFAFIDRRGEASSLGDVLPPALERLELSGCTKLIQRWVSVLHQTRNDGGLGWLRSVDLSFDMCIREALLLIDQGCGLLSTLCTDVAQLTMMGLRIGYLDMVHGHTSSDLFTELNAWSHLSDMEAWYAAMKRQEFSATVALSENGEPRRRSRVELRSFLRQDRVSLRGHMVFRFTPQVPLSNAPMLTFGTKRSDTKFDLKCVPDVEVWTKIYAHYKIPASATVTSTVTSRVEYSPSAPSSPSAHSFFHKRPSGHEPTTSMEKFNGDEWAGVVFFSNLKAPSPPRSESQKRRFKERSVTRSNSSQVSSRRRLAE